MSYIECFNNVETPMEAAEAIHCVQKYGETVLFDRNKNRLIMWRELYDKSPEEHMIKISRILGIDSLEHYQEVDKLYNLTMY
ncbi:MAG: hypothetical protein QXZ44_03335 [Ferroplasma sp.]